MALFRALASIALVAGSAFAQHVISARSGLIHYTEGAVLLGDKRIDPKPAEFPEMKPGDVLRTEEGRAEVLLTPGAFLRLSENSSFRLLTNALENTRLELLSGEALLEAAEVLKGQPLVVTAGPATVEVTKSGLFRFTSDPARMQVFDGSAVLVANGQTYTIKEGRQTALAGVISPEKFNKDVKDAFHRWAARRAGYIAMANVAAAKSIDDLGASWNSSGWLFNSYLGMFTFVPFQGRYVDPFGYSFYSPRAVGRLFYRPEPPMFPNHGGGMDAGRGYPDMGGRGTMSVGRVPSAAPSAAPSAPPPAAAPPRGADAGSSRGVRGGR